MGLKRGICNICMVMKRAECMDKYGYQKREIQEMHGCKKGASACQGTGAGTPRGGNKAVLVRRVWRRVFRRLLLSSGVVGTCMGLKKLEN